MSPYDWFILAIIFLSNLTFIGALLVHERREFKRQDIEAAANRDRQHEHELHAIEREERAVERHDREMSALVDARRLMLAAIAHRDALMMRVDLLERAADNHAGHLTALGRIGVYVIPPRGEG
jgi:hypothetical protein